MPKEYTREQLWKLYQGLPEELREAMWSDENADSIWSICQSNGLGSEEDSKITKYVGYVLLGLLPVDDFQKTLQKEVGLKNGTAKQVAQEIYRHIFFPVRSLLEELYKVDIAARLAKPADVSRVAGASVPTGPVRVAEAPADGATPEVAPVQEKPRLKKPDVYRESVE